MNITITLNVPKWLKAIADAQARLDTAIRVTMNMIASMAEEAGRADIAASGKFGARWIFGLHCDNINNQKLSMYHDISTAIIFETGGVIEGNPFLWLPLSGTDAEGVQAKDYSGGLFSAKSSKGTPLLFAQSDKLPRYFAIPSVHISPKWDLEGDFRGAVSKFQSVFDTAWEAA